MQPTAVCLQLVPVLIQSSDCSCRRLQPPLQHCTGLTQPIRCMMASVQSRYFGVDRYKGSNFASENTQYSYSFIIVQGMV